MLPATAPAMISANATDIATRIERQGERAQASLRTFGQMLSTARLHPASQAGHGFRRACGNWQDRRFLLKALCPGEQEDAEQRSGNLSKRIHRPMESRRPAAGCGRDRLHHDHVAQRPPQSDAERCARAGSAASRLQMRSKPSRAASGHSRPAPGICDDRTCRQRARRSSW